MIRFLLTGACLVAGLAAHACNACGGASGGTFSGILPQQQNHFVGIRYAQKRLSNDGLQFETATPAEHHQYNSLDVYGRFYVWPKVQILAYVPYGIHTMEVAGSPTETISSIGDMTVLANYNIVNTAASEHAFKHNWFAGGGIKLATGKYQQRNSSRIMLAPGFQVGTGAYSFIANTIYTVRYKNVGFNANAQYKVNGTNELDYRFGNQFNASALFFYWKNIGQTVLLPNAGVSAETMQTDTQYDRDVENTGGQNLFATAGADLYWKKFGLGGYYQYPISTFTNNLNLRNTGQWGVNLMMLF